MKITMPWPDKRLTPNARRRLHWRRVQPVIKQARECAYKFTLTCVHFDQRKRLIRSMGEGKIKVHVTFYPPDRRKRDDDGMIGQFKPYRDGICDALGIDDHRWKTSYTVAEPEKPGRIEITIGKNDD